jgi:hypothetical protein
VTASRLHQHLSSHKQTSRRIIAGDVAINLWHAAYRQSDGIPPGDLTLCLGHDLAGRHIVKRLDCRPGEMEAISVFPGNSHQQGTRRLTLPSSSEMQRGSHSRAANKFLSRDQSRLSFGFQDCPLANYFNP